MNTTTGNTIEKLGNTLGTRPSSLQALKFHHGWIIHTFHPNLPRPHSWECFFYSCPMAHLTYLGLWYGWLGWSLPTTTHGPRSYSLSDMALLLGYDTHISTGWSAYPNHWGPSHFLSSFLKFIWIFFFPILFIIKAKILMLIIWSHRFPPPQYVDYGGNNGYHILSTQPNLFIIYYI